MTHHTLEKRMFKETLGREKEEKKAKHEWQSRRHKINSYTEDTGRMPVSTIMVAPYIIFHILSHASMTAWMLSRIWECKWTCMSRYKGISWNILSVCLSVKADGLIYLLTPKGHLVTLTSGQGCARLMSYESNLTRLWLKWVESESSRPWKSRSWVESESNHSDRHLSQSWVNWIPLESKLSHWFFRRENVKILHLRIALQEKNRPTATFDRTPSPSHPSGQQILVKLGKMWWVVSQVWLNSDSNWLSQSWMRLGNLAFELSRSWVNQEK